MWSGHDLKGVCAWILLHDPAVIHFACAGYITNGRFLNHCLVAFLKRLADPDGINLEPMIWQASHMTSFHVLQSFSILTCLCMSVRRSEAHSKTLAVKLLQVSVLRVFHQLLASAPFRKQPGSSEILRFAVRIVHNIFARLVPAKSAMAGISPIEGEYAGGSRVKNHVSCCAHACC